MVPRGVAHYNTNSTIILMLFYSNHIIIIIALYVCISNGYLNINISFLLLNML